MKIENIPLDIKDHYLSPVTYLPSHVGDNAGHEDCEQGVIISINPRSHTVTVLYCKSRTAQVTEPKYLVWG